MSATIGIQLITPATGTAQGQAQQQADDNSAKAVAKAVANNLFVDAIKQLKQSEPAASTAREQTHQVDRSA